LNTRSQAPQTRMLTELHHAHRGFKESHLEYKSFSTEL